MRVHRTMVLLVILGWVTACGATPTPTVRPTPRPTDTLMPMVTIDGKDPSTGLIIEPINVWKDYNNRAAGIATTVKDGQRVQFVRRTGDGVLIQTHEGKRGWVTYWFIEEFK